MIGKYLTLAKDIAIVAALAFLVWRIYALGESHVEKKDLQAVNQQLTQNTQTISRWAQEAHSAAQQHTDGLAKVTAAIGAQRQPVFLQPAPNPGRSCPVPGTPTAPSGAPAASGGTDEGRGVDLRPAINAFELKYEKTLADCRLVLESWPH